MAEFRNAKARSERLVKDFDAMLAKINDLAQANRKLREELINVKETFQTREEARERVLKSLDEKHS